MKVHARRSIVRAVHVNDPDALTPLPGHRLVATIYDLIPLRLGIPARRIIGWAGYQAYVRSLRRVDIYLAISQATAADLGTLLHVPAQRIRLAPPGVDLRTPAGPPPQPPERPYFLFLGGPNPNKNLDVLLDAMVLCSELPEELVVAGHWLPAQQARLDARLEAAGLRGRVRFKGFIPDEDLFYCLRQATALVMPSRLEGFGLPVAEGLAAGAAVVHSRIPVLEETSQGAALTFDPDSPAELAECLRVISRDRGLSRELRRRGRERATSLTWDAAVRTALAAYRELAGG
jgi:glycosyltransferase involved in cell wall biosynthesis